MTMVPVPARSAPARVKAILDELKRVVFDYTAARSDYEAARVHFEAARERLASIKKIASQVLSYDDWYRWQFSNPTVQYAGMSIGDAISHALDNRAYQCAADVVHATAGEFDPAMTLEQIVEELEGGGFEFRTPTPRREVNAALMKLDGIKTLKTEDGGPVRYVTEEAEDILELFRTSHDDDEPDEAIEAAVNGGQQVTEGGGQLGLAPDTQTKGG